ncbi:hypothetical protein BLA39750_01190 [Burkholderia lata]|uniref:Uncharacterized protein n=1 Tax=Burkholderia lata (strain ATCC 17760 / DSM 23089 / LMG 22485 / NCIMB 9086 / R18194 / 383) TaxID=482957 RepID=A0A6P2VKC7_BURL3|nr:hypothetical protein [Burkholderia lata]VWC80907.1 hypothetical protein BLA39750_01190 [Burkholderia lata]
MTRKNSVGPNWERIGDVAVDSGQVVIIDPSYIDRHWVTKPLQDVRQYRHKVTGKIVEYEKDFRSYDFVIPEFGQSANQLLATGEWEKIVQPVPFELSYNAACLTTRLPARGGNFGGSAIAVGTLDGDGPFPVIVERDERGQILRLMVDFT